MEGTKTLEKGKDKAIGRQRKREIIFVFITSVLISSGMANSKVCVQAKIKI